MLITHRVNSPITEYARFTVFTRILLAIKGRHRRESKNAKQMRNTKQNCF